MPTCAWKEASNNLHWGSSQTSKMEYYCAEHEDFTRKQKADSDFFYSEAFATYFWTPWYITFVSLMALGSSTPARVNMWWNWYKKQQLQKTVKSMSFQANSHFFSRLRSLVSKQRPILLERNLKCFRKSNLIPSV